MSNFDTIMLKLNTALNNMRHMKWFEFIGSIMILATIFSSVGLSVSYYVSPTGTDNSSQGTGTGLSAFKTIQYTINDGRVVSGDVINVEAGVYSENLVLNKSLTLQGAGQTMTTILRNTSVSQVVLIQANNVTVSGFKIDGGSAYLCDNLIKLSTAGSVPYEQLTVTNNHLIHSKLSAVYLGGKAVSPEDGTLIGRSYKINDNIIEFFGCGDCSDDWGGIGAFKALGIEVKRNIIRDATADTGYATYGSTGIYFFDYTGGVIADNNISRTYGAIMVNSNVEETNVTGNIMSESIMGISQTESFAKLNIIGNTIYTKSDPSYSGMFQRGISLGGDGDTYNSSPPYAWQLANLMHNVSGNIVIGTNTASSFGIRVKAGMIDGDWASSGTVTNNMIANFSTGLMVYGKGNSGGDKTNLTNVSFTNNIITGSTLHTAVSSWTNGAGSISAVNNWWGSAVLSEITAKMSDRFSYVPFYTNPEMTETAHICEHNNVTLCQCEHYAIVTNISMPLIISFDMGQTEGTLDVSSLMTNGSGVIPQITIDSSVAQIYIPSTTLTNSNISWNGQFNAPMLIEVDFPAQYDVGMVISLSHQGELTFANAVRIVMPNQKDKHAFHYTTAGGFHEITDACVADNQSSGDLLSSDGECIINNGNDLVIWTKHFSEFGTFNYAYYNVSTAKSVLGMSPLVVGLGVLLGIFGTFFLRDEEESMIALVMKGGVISLIAVVMLTILVSIIG